MPEGDVVLRTSRRLAAALAGQVLTRFELRVPRYATADLTGRTVREVVARGKHLLVRVDGDVTLHSHLRMDGAWYVIGAGERWRGGPAHQVRAVLGTERWVALGYRLHDIELVETRDEARLVGHLGPDVLAADFDADLAVSRLSAAADRAVGEALLDQRNLSGVGNLYKAESLFLHRTSPWAPVGEVADMPGLVGTVVRLMVANVDNVGQVTTGGVHREPHWVYARAGRACLRCGTRIRQAEQGRRPESRVTYWCPNCQKGPVPPVVDHRPGRSSSR